MACGARSGLKLEEASKIGNNSLSWNGLWGPFGIETVKVSCYTVVEPRLEWLVVEREM